MVKYPDIKQIIMDLISFKIGCGKQWGTQLLSNALLVRVGDVPNAILVEFKNWK
jgi:hypothetical protein